MKRKSLLLVLVMVLAFVLVMAAACHEHTFGAWELTTEPTEDAAGKATRTCECGETETVDVAKLTDASVWTKSAEKAATHTEDGSRTYTSDYGTVTVTLDKGVGAHTYSWKITKEPTLAATGLATGTCACGDKQENVKLEKLSDKMWTVKTTDSTCVTKGKSVYTSTYGTVTVELDLAAHTYGAWTLTKDPTAAAVGTATHTCTVTGCGHVETKTDVAVLTDTSVWTVDTAKSTNSTCVTKGKTVYTSDYGTVTVDKDLVAHTYGAWKLTKDPTDKVVGTATHTCTVTGCGHNETKNDVAILTDTSVWTAQTIAADYNHAGSTKYTSVYGTVNIETAPKLVAPYDNKTYHSVNVDSTGDNITDGRAPVHASWNAATLTVDANGVGIGSEAVPFQGKFVFTMVDAATGKISVSVYEKEGETYATTAKETFDAFVDMETGILVLPHQGGRLDWVNIAVPEETVTANQFVADCWTLGNEFAIAIDYTKETTPYGIYIENDTVHFDTTYKCAVPGQSGSMEFATVSASDIVSGGQMNYLTHIYGSDDKLISSFALSTGKTVMEFMQTAFGGGEGIKYIITRTDGKEGIYKGKVDGVDTTLFVNGGGLITSSSMMGFYDVAADGANYTLGAYIGDQMPVYYAVTLTGDGMSEQGGTYTATAVKVKITYNTNGVTPNPALTESVVEVGKLSLQTLPVLENENKLMLGWFLDAACTQPVPVVKFAGLGNAEFFLPENDVTLYAKWSNKVSVTIVGGVAGGPTTVGLPVGEQLSDFLPYKVNEIYGNMYCAGWYLDAEHKNPLDTEITITAEDLNGKTLYVEMAEVPACYGTYYGTAYGSDNYIGTAMYTMTIGLDGTITANLVDPWATNRQILTSGKITRIEGQKVFYQVSESDAETRYFFFDAQAGIIAGLYYQNNSIGSNYFLLSRNLSKNNYQAHTYYTIKIEDKSTHVLTLDLEYEHHSEQVNILLHQDQIYSNVNLVELLSNERIDATMLADVEYLRIEGSDSAEILSVAVDKSKETPSLGKGALILNGFGNYGLTGDSLVESAALSKAILDGLGNVLVPVEGISDDKFLYTVTAINGIPYGVVATYEKLADNSYEAYTYHSEMKQIVVDQDDHGNDITELKRISTKVAYFTFTIEGETMTVVKPVTDIEFSYVGAEPTTPVDAMHNINLKMPIDLYTDEQMALAGYLFLGFFSDEECKSSVSATGYIPTAEAIAEGKITIYAKYSSSAIITLVFNNGTENGTVNAPLNQPLPVEDPLYPMHIFAGWYEDHAFDEATKWTEGKLVTASVTLYAKWDNGPAWYNTYNAIQIDSTNVAGGVSSLTTKDIDLSVDVAGHATGTMYPFRGDITISYLDEDIGKLKITVGSDVKIGYINKETGIIVMNENSGETADMNKVFLLSPFGKIAKTEIANSYWSAGKVRAIQYTVKDTTYSIFVINNRAYFDVAFKSSNNFAATDNILSAAEVYNHDAYVFTADGTTLIAQPNVTVTLDTKGHGNAVDPITVNAGKAVDISGITLTADGYKFRGWFTDEAYSTPADSVLYPTANTTLYAKWDDMITVTFNYNDGDTPTKKVVNNVYAVNDPVSLEAVTFANNGLSFVGWFTKNNNEWGNQVVDGTGFATDIDLYAKWEDTYAMAGEYFGWNLHGTGSETKTYPQNDKVTIGSDGAASGTELTSGNIDSSYKTVTDGVIQIGGKYVYFNKQAGVLWYCHGANSTGVGTDTNVAISGDVSSVDYSRKYNYSYNGKSTMVAWLTINYKNGYSKNVFLFNNVVYSNVTWTDGITAKTANDANHVVYASNGKPIVARVGSAMKDLDGLQGTYTGAEGALVIDGIGNLTLNSVAGTYTDKEGVLQVYLDSKKVYKEITLNTTEKTYTATTPTAVLSFNMGEGVPTMDNVNVNLNVTYTLPTPAERAGFVFRGWYEDAAFGGYAKTSVKLTSTDAKTVYAKWDAQATITFVHNDGETENSTLTKYYVSDKVADADIPKHTETLSDGRVFIGWFTADGTDENWGEEFTKNTVLTEATMSIYGKWIMPYAMAGSYKGWNFYKTIDKNQNVSGLSSILTISVTGLANGAQVNNLQIPESDKNVVDGKIMLGDKKSATYNSIGIIWYTYKGSDTDDGATYDTNLMFDTEKIVSINLCGIKAGSPAYMYAWLEVTLKDNSTVNVLLAEYNIYTNVTFKDDSGELGVNSTIKDMDHKIYNSDGIEIAAYTAEGTIFKFSDGTTGTYTGTIGDIVSDGYGTITVGGAAAEILAIDGKKLTLVVSNKMAVVTLGTGTYTQEFDGFEGTYNLPDNAGTIKLDGKGGAGEGNTYVVRGSVLTVYNTSASTSTDYGITVGNPDLLGRSIFAGLTFAGTDNESSPIYIIFQDSPLISGTFRGVWAGSNYDFHFTGANYDLTTKILTFTISSQQGAYTNYVGTTITAKVEEGKITFTSASKTFKWNGTGQIIDCSVDCADFHLSK